MVKIVVLTSVNRKQNLKEGSISISLCLKWIYLFFIGRSVDILFFFYNHVLSQKKDCAVINTEATICYIGLVVVFVIVAAENIPH